MKKQNKQELIKKIKEKKEYSSIPDSEVEKILGEFTKKDQTEKEKFKIVREMLMKLFSGTMSKKLLSPKILEKKSPEEVLKKHLSTRERFEHYGEIYSRIFSGLDLNKKREISVIDLGAGINGLSYNKFPEGFEVNYIGVEIVGRLVDLMNEYYRKEGLEKRSRTPTGSAEAIQESLFNLEKIKDIVKKTKKPRIVFLFKILDSLEWRERDYSKKLLLELKNLGIRRFVLSFSTESFIKKEKFKAKRKWIQNFIKENFREADSFELGGERYIVFE